MHPRLRLPFLRGPLAVLLLGLALALRVLAPGGVMPVAAPAGLAMVLCTGDGQPASRPLPVLPARASAHDCSFCQIASPLLAGDLPGLPPRNIVPAAPRLAARLVVFPEFASLRVAPPARAPPLLV